MNAELELFCPRMKVTKIDKWTRQADEEPMRATVVLEDGRIYSFGPVIIPKTLIRWQSFLHWRVDACIGETAAGMVPSCRVELPKEDTWREGVWMYAQPITCDTVVTLGDGSKWHGWVTFPKCRFNCFTGYADEVVARGELRHIC